MYYDQSRFPSSEEREFIHAAAKTAAKIFAYNIEAIKPKDCDRLFIQMFKIWIF